MRVHDLRHVHASLAIAQGADPKALQARLGHTGLAMTLGVYAHRVQGADRRVADSIALLLEDAGRPSAMRPAGVHQE